MHTLENMVAVRLVVVAAAAVETCSHSAAHGGMGHTMYPRLTSSLRQAVLLPQPLECWDRGLHASLW